MSIFSIDCRWVCYRTVEVEAETEEQAMEKVAALQDFGEYMSDDTFEMDVTE